MLDPLNRSNRGSTRRCAPSRPVLLSQVTNCGPRTQYYDNGDAIGDDSCINSNNGVCEDGGPGSSFHADDFGVDTSVCKFAQDRTDCPLRKMVTLGALSFSNEGSPPVPLPPPYTPHSAAHAPPPPSAFTSCNRTCTGYAVCTDGGLGALTVGGTFRCDYGSQARPLRRRVRGAVRCGAPMSRTAFYPAPRVLQCDLCGARLHVDWVGSDTAGLQSGLAVGGATRNGVCEDVAMGGREGYGALCSGMAAESQARETVDCGRRAGGCAPALPAPPHPTAFAQERTVRTATAHVASSRRAARRASSVPIDDRGAGRRP